MDEDLKLPVHWLLWTLVLLAFVGIFRLGPGLPEAGNERPAKKCSEVCAGEAKEDDDAD